MMILSIFRVPLLVLLFLNIQQSQAIRFDGTGITTEQGVVIKWEEISSVSSEIKSLRRLCFVTASIVLGCVAYQIWREYSQSKNNQSEIILDGCEKSNDNDRVIE